MNSPADIVSQHLIDLGIASSPSTSSPKPTFVGQLPDKPNTCIGCFDTRARKDGRLMQGHTIFHPAVQVLVRASDYREAYDLAYTIKEAIDNIKNTTIVVEGNSYQVKSASLTTDVLSLGNDSDKNRRQMMSVNLRITL